MRVSALFYLLHSLCDFFRYVGVLFFAIVSGKVYGNALAFALVAVFRSYLPDYVLKGFYYLPVSSYKEFLVFNGPYFKYYPVFGLLGFYVLRS